MKTKVILLLFATQLLLCCNRIKKSSYCDNHMVLRYQPVDTINGELFIIGDSVPGVVGIVATPQQLITIHDDVPYYFTAFAYNGRKLLSFGTKGHSANEFLTNDLLKQYTHDGCLVLNDVNSRQLKFINIGQTITSQHICIAKVENTEPASLAAWNCGEKDNIIIQQLPSNFMLLRTGEKYKIKMELYESFSPSFPIYQSLLCVDKKGENIAMPMIYMNQINFYSFKDEKRKSVSMYVNAHSPNEGSTHTYYCSVCTDGSLIYALYMDQEESEAYSTPKSMEIHIFDYNGNIKRVLACPQYVVDIDCDTDKYLYGLDIDGNIYRYEI